MTIYQIENLDLHRICKELILQNSPYNPGKTGKKVPRIPIPMMISETMVKIFCSINP